MPLTSQSCSTRGDDFFAGRHHWGVLFWVERVLYAVSILLLGAIVVSSVTRPEIGWDGWAYHLPFGAMIWDIHHAREAFLLDEQLTDVYFGFPLFAEFLQGGLWRLSGTVASVPLINSLGLVGFIATAHAVTRVSLPVLTFSVLSVPMIVLHTSSGFVDLFAGAMIAFQVLTSAILVAGCRQEEPATDRKRFRLAALGYLAAAGAAGNTKFTSLVISLAVSGFVLAFLVLGLVLTKCYASRRSKYLVGVVLLASVLSAGTALKNIHAYRNPFFPLELNLPSVGIHLAGPWPRGMRSPEYTAKFGPLAAPLNWGLSLTELDWVIRGVEWAYTPDSYYGDRPRKYGPARTGGYGGGLVIMSVTLGLVLAARVAQTERDALRQNGFFVCLFLFVSALTAFMPQSHDLRYQLYWPLLLMLTVCILMKAAKLGSLETVFILLLYVGSFLFYEYTIRFPLRMFPPRPPEEVITAKGASPEVAFARRTGGTCLGVAYAPNHFMYASVFHGGRYVIEQGWPKCRRYPEYTPESLDPRGRDRVN
jgi:hypothetical protein